jgi:hypothetical protein
MQVFIGSSQREDYTAYGWGVTLAARMMQRAGEGEYWMDEEVARRAAKHFNLNSPNITSKANMNKSLCFDRAQEYRRDRVKANWLVAITSRWLLLLSHQAATFAGVMV